MIKNKKLSAVGEFGLIHLIQKKISKNKNVVKGIGDDTAVLPYDKSHYLLFTTDMVMEGVHFTSSTDPVAVGYKAMACNISDIAAMGGKPTYAVVSLGVSADRNVKFVQDIYRGMEMACKKFSVAIVGGDTIKSGKLIINVALLGTVDKKKLVLRSGAKPGDTIFVTGPLGRSFQTGKHLCLAPRVKEAEFLVNNFKPTAMIDVSDGLTADLGHILEESKTGAIIYEELIPKTKGASLKNALSDGEDFELLFTFSHKDTVRLLKLKNKSFYPIGRILRQNQGLRLVSLKGKVSRLSAKGFTHF